MDGNFPYLHVERKFMHLGFHIYDVGFQSPNVEAARPLVYATLPAGDGDRRPQPDGDRYS
jgi:ABC-type phosphate transport system permease subunit